MLILQRRPGEQILIGTDIIVTICNIDGEKVRIGIDAPRHIPIVRRELAGQDRADMPPPQPAPVEPDPFLP